MLPTSRLLPTAHALKRWSERFPLEDIDYHWVNAIPLGRNQLKKIETQLTGAHRRLLSEWKGVVLLYSKRMPNMVFVTQPIAAGRFQWITVLDVDNPINQRRSSSQQTAGNGDGKPRKPTRTGNGNRADCGFADY